MATHKFDNILNGWLQTDLPLWHIYQKEKYQWFHHNWEQLFPFSSKRFYNVMTPVHSLFLPCLEKSADSEALFLLDGSVSALFYLLKTKPKENDLIILPHSCSRTIPSFWKDHIQFYHLQTLSSKKREKLLLILETIGGVDDFKQIETKIVKYLKEYREVSVVVNIQGDRLLYNPAPAQEVGFYQKLFQMFAGKIDLMSQNDFLKLENLYQYDYEILSKYFYGYSYFDEYLLTRGARIKEAKTLLKKTTTVRISPFHEAIIGSDKLQILKEEDEKYLVHNFRRKENLDYMAYCNILDVIN